MVKATLGAILPSAIGKEAPKTEGTTKEKILAFCDSGELPLVSERRLLAARAILIGFIRPVQDALKKTAVKGERRTALQVRRAEIQDIIDSVVHKLKVKFAIDLKEQGGPYRADKSYLDEVREYFREAGISDQFEALPTPESSSLGRPGGHSRVVNHSNKSRGQLEELAAQMRARAAGKPNA